MEAYQAAVTHMTGRWTGALFLLTLMCAGSAAADSASQPAQARPQYLRLADLFGESDEEKAARLQHEATQDTEIANLKQQVIDLEQSLQQVTGQNEQLSHQIQELNARIDQQKKDFEFKLCALAAQQLGAGTTPDASGNGLPCNPSQAVSTLIAPSGLPASPPPGRGTPGTLPAPPPADHSQYDQAMNLLASAQYDQARAAFRSYADANPQDSLTPLAVYWVGDIAYVQKDYAGAAQAFAEELKKYPTSTRGPDSMLKLGQSLVALGQKKEGCLTLGAIKSKYPTASAFVLTQAQSTRAAAQCK
jgi:tol-pal system protein YbgF